MAASAAQILKILFLLPFPPRLDAAHGGGRVMAQCLAAAAARHRAALVYFRGLDEPPLDEALRERCELAVEIKRTWTRRSSFQRWLRNGWMLASLMRFRPLWVTDWASSEFGEHVQALVQTWNPDLVQIEYHIMGQYAACLNGSTAPRVLVEHEPGIRAAPHLRDVPNSIKYLIHQVDQIAWRRFEPEVLRRVQAVIAFTQSDKKTLEALGTSTLIYHIPFGTALPDNPLNPAGCPPLSLVFVGSFIHPPNVEAADRLARLIFPRVQKFYPELELYIVGDQPPLHLKELSSEKIHITGWVPEVAPYLDRAAVFTAPLVSGGGMRVKTLEALAAGKAVVATPLAIEGLNLEDGEQVSLARDDQEMTEKIVHLLDHPEQRMAIAQRARAWACENLGWNRSVEAYEALWQGLLSNG